MTKARLKIQMKPILQPSNKVNGLCTAKQVRFTSIKPIYNFPLDYRLVEPAGNRPIKTTATSKEQISYSKPAHNTQNTTSKHHNSHAKQPPEEKLGKTKLVE